jgi:NAD+ diphosphatase
MTATGNSAPLVFTSGGLDRAGDLRSDPNWLAARRADSRARILLFSQLKPLLSGAEGAAETALRFLSRADANRLGGADADEVFLGLDGETAYFARDVSASGNEVAKLGVEAHFHDARAALDLLPISETAIMGQAKALIDWHQRHRFCSTCGAKTAMEDGGYRRHCGPCGANHFPRTDPAAIMLVVRGENCLLARNRRFGVAHNHSALAGFLEPGESIEDCVRREVFEEVGIRVGAVRYSASQPWPFPSSLMLGCIAEAISSEIRVDGSEIVSARWFERETIRRMLAGEEIGGVKLPRPVAIAWHLIRTWAEG